MTTVYYNEQTCSYTVVDDNGNVVDSGANSPLPAEQVPQLADGLIRAMEAMAEDSLAQATVARPSSLQELATVRPGPALSVNYANYIPWTAIVESAPLTPIPELDPEPEEPGQDQEPAAPLSDVAKRHADARRLEELGYRIVPASDRRHVGQVQVFDLPVGATDVAVVSRGWANRRGILAEGLTSRAFIGRPAYVSTNLTPLFARFIAYNPYDGEVIKMFVTPDGVPTKVGANSGGLFAARRLSSNTQYQTVDRDSEVVQANDPRIRFARRALADGVRRIYRDHGSTHPVVINPSMIPRDVDVYRPIEYRGARVSADAYKCIKRVCATVGKAITNGATDDVDQVLEEIRNLDTCAAGISNRLIERWNLCCDRVHDGWATIIRAECGHLCTECEAHSTYDGEVCDDCFDEYYVLCEDDDMYHHRENVYRHEDGEYYTYSEDDDNDAPCVRDYSTNVLRYLKPDTSFIPSPFGDFLMGIELEVMPRRYERGATAVAVNKTLCKNYAILKNDGSLSTSQGTGFEIVTAPRSLKEHIERFSQWEIPNGLTAWDTGVCGMHVHMSSAGFSQATLGKFIEFINASDNERFILDIAGRHPRSDGNAADYCQQEGRSIHANPKMQLTYKSASRYRMVNTTNLSESEAYRLGLSREHNHKSLNTIELRIFRATLRKERLLAQIEFAHAAVMFCRAASIRGLTSSMFKAWLRDMAGVYPNLCKWYGIRQNKPVAISANESLANAACEV